MNFVLFVNLLAVLTSCLVILPLSYAQDDPDVSPIAAWLFDDGFGKLNQDAVGIVEDRTGNGHDGRIVGDVKWRRGRYGMALEFLSDDEDWGHVQVPHHDDLSLQAFTITAWIKVAKLIGPQKKVKTDAEPAQMIVDKEVLLIAPNKVAAVKNRNYSMWIRADGNPGSFACGFWNSFPEKNPLETERTKRVTDDEWHFVACAFDGNTLSAFVDGNELSKIENKKVQGITPKLHKVKAPLYIGAQQQPQPLVGEHAFEKGIQGVGGTVDDVALYNVGLAPETLKSIMELGLAGKYGYRPVSPKDKLTTTWAKLKAE